MMVGEHLHESRRYALALSDEERCQIIRQDIKINTEHLLTVSNIVHNMLSIVRGSTEAPCLLVSAGSNHGKTTICNAIRGMDESWSHKIRYVSFVKDTEKTKPMMKLLAALGMEAGRAGIPISMVAEYCIANDIRAVFMDEFHDALKGLSKGEQDTFLSLLRGLCGAPAYLSFFIFGIDEAYNALAIDPQYVRRFELYELSPWARADAEYLNFLDTWEEIAPLAKKSHLSSKAIADYIYSKTSGVIGNICSLLRAAGCLAVTWGDEKITLEGLQASTKSKWNTRVTRPSIIE
ncbi:TniB family NTP-binding protein [Pseudomonas sp. Au-Pse12]|uniref:TniB family NTP-binding protein n=1 Tax=Pseudomonas sp. Au-Pse12 TaxID=2906459 RepID=UPI001E636926|nr:TniB family NTP-binding protein [Pseudomonas sp. Au-Pse12]MCE4052854.1 TniB family NTP-binding protein [Pseudomonas sp. Au-Pse12]